MMGRGSSKASGGSDIKRSNSIKNQILDKAMNSRLAGVRRDATNGTGNYTFKNSTAVSENRVSEIKSAKIFEKDGYTLIDGEIDGKSVFYANKSDTPAITKYKKNVNEKKHKQAEEMKRSERPEIRTTSTYDRWRKKNQKNFDAWFGKR